MYHRGFGEKTFAFALINLLTSSFPLSNMSQTVYCLIYRRLFFFLKNKISNFETVSIPCTCQQGIPSNGKYELSFIQIFQKMHLFCHRHFIFMDTTFIFQRLYKFSDSCGKLIVIKNKPIVIFFLSWDNVHYSKKN